MALYQNRLAAFEYNDDWMKDGFSISPFSLPLEKKVFMPRIDPFEGLFGVFADSLPDGWGRLLVDRLMRKNGLNPQTIGNLGRLSIVGTSGMEDIIAVAKRIGLNTAKAKKTASEIRDCVFEMLSDYVL